MGSVAWCDPVLIELRRTLPIESARSRRAEESISSLSRRAAVVVVPLKGKLLRLRRGVRQRRTAARRTQSIAANSSIPGLSASAIAHPRAALLGTAAHSPSLVPRRSPVGPAFATSM